ncbi:MAG: hypothetical protein ACR2HY_04860 [Acidimicrobiales bacterium]
MRRAAVMVVALAALAGACARSKTTYRVETPSFHSAGPGATEELQSVLDSQAASIGGADWRSLYDQFVPSERSRCSYDQFLRSATGIFGPLHDQAGSSALAAQVSRVQVSGFRASVDYKFVLPASGLASPAQSAHYLKVGDRWYIDEKAC